MDLYRKIAIAIIMIVPTFVFSGLVFELLHAYWPIYPVIAIMIVVYALIIKGKFFYRARNS